MEALEARTSTTDALAPAAARPANCLNCGERLHGVYCSACGQRDIPPYPSVRELVIDAFWELSGWDGRFASTVRALVRRPGMLTREFLEGRRARYLSPLRLYLLSSLAYFLLAAAAPSLTLKSGNIVLGGTLGDVQFDGAPASRPERVAGEARDALQNGTALPDSVRKAALADIARAPALMRPFLRKAVDDPSGFKRGLVEAMPRMLFALLPVFAVLVAIFYRGKKYPEHFYFAIHLHAFIFFALGLAAAVKYMRVPVLGVTAELASLLWVVAYTTMAFRRVYGGSMVATLAKEGAIGIVYGVISAAALVVTIYLVSLGA